MAGEGQHDADRAQGQGERGTTIGDEGQRDAHHGDDPGDHRDVDGRLAHQPGQDPPRGQADERGRGPGGDAVDADRQAEVGQQHHQRAHEPELLAEDGEDEVVLGLRDVAPLLSGLAEARAPPAAGGQGVHPVRRLEAGVGGVRAVPHPGLHPDHAVRGEEGQGQDAQHAQRQEGEEDPPMGAGHVQHRGQHDREDDRGPEVAARHHQDQQQQAAGQHRDQRVPHLGDEAVLALQDRRRPQGQGELGGLGGLHPEPADAQPVAIAAHGDAERGERDQREQDHGHAERRPGERLEDAHRQAREHEQGRHARHRPGALAQEQRVRAAAGADRLDGGRREHHHEPQHGEQGGAAADEQDRQVEGAAALEDPPHPAQDPLPVLGGVVGRAGADRAELDRGHGPPHGGSETVGWRRVSRRRARRRRARPSRARASARQRPR